MRAVSHRAVGLSAGGTGRLATPGERGQHEHLGLYRARSRQVSMITWLISRWKREDKAERGGVQGYG